MSDATASRHDAEEQADRLLSAAIYLMTCHGRTGCPRLACMIEGHLRAISRLPDVGERVRDTCLRLAAAWTAIRKHDEKSFKEQPADATPPVLLH